MPFGSAIWERRGGREDRGYEGNREGSGGGHSTDCSFVPDKVTQHMQQPLLSLESPENTQEVQMDSVMFTTLQRSAILLRARTRARQSSWLE